MELSKEALDVIAKVEKLMALAGNNPNENEAAVAAAKAQELLAAYNLDMAMVGRSDNERKDDRLKGGLYEWQRELWDSCCRLNFCLYRFYRGLTKGSSYEHRIIGRPENVASARVMAEYLQQTIERLAREETKARGHKSVFVREMIAFREGVSDRLRRRLYDLRQERLAEDKRKQDEANARNRHPSAPPSDGKSLVLADVLQTEDDFNQDQLYGLPLGTTASKRAEAAARRAAARAAYDEEIRKRDLAELADPSLKEARLAKEEEGRKAEQKRQEEWARKFRNRTYRDRKPTAREARSNTHEYFAGYAKGADIGLDKQVDKKSARRIK